MPDDQGAANDAARSGQVTSDGKTNSKTIAGWLALALAVIAIDQGVKWLVLQTFVEHERVNVIPNFFDLTLWYNPGAAFGMLASAGGWQRWFFTAVGVVASVFIVYLLRQSTDQRLFSFGIAMILGGAIGNVIDRLIHSKVVDFLLFYLDPYYFPAFNLADSAITLGAACLILDEILRWRRHRKASRQ
ncbi:MAG: signal peptidase II [Burkholderiaceae bacterium]